MTPTTHILQHKKAVKDDCHRLKLYSSQRLWEGRFITHEKRQPAMLKVIMYTENKNG